MVSTNGQMAAFIRAIIPSESEMAKAKWFIRMIRNMKGTGCKGKSMGVVSTNQGLMSLSDTGTKASSRRK